MHAICESVKQSCAVSVTWVPLYSLVESSREDFQFLAKIRHQIVQWPCFHKSFPLLTVEQNEPNS